MSQELTTCVVCETDKTKVEFSLRSSVTGKRHTVCKDCQKSRAKKHYEENKERYKDRAKKWVELNPDKRKDVSKRSAVKRSRQSKIEAIEYKGGKCVDCDGVFQPCVYDFHHIDPTEKDAHLAQLLGSRGFEAAKAELDKCVLLCANCHRIRHHGT